MSSHPKPQSGPMRSDDTARRAFLERDVLVTRFDQELWDMTEVARERPLTEEERLDLARRFRARVKEFGDAILGSSEK